MAAVKGIKTSAQFGGVEEPLLNGIQEELVNVLKRNGPMSRSQLVDSLNRPRTTIYDNLAALIDKEVAKKFPRQLNARGRPTVFFKLKEE